MARADLLFEKDAYNPDEVANIICKLDNTKCEKDISEVQVQLKREIVCHDSHAKAFIDTKTIVKRTYPGIAAGAMEEKYLALNLKDITNENKYTKKHMKSK